MFSFATSARADEPLRYLALGDSYSIGEGVAETGRWPNQLARALRDDGFALDDPRIIARTGWTTDELSAAMDAAEPLGQWDFVSLLVGVNNQYRGRGVENYREEFERLLRRAIVLAANRPDRVLVLAIPDWGVTPFARQSGRDREQIARELDAYNAAAAERCRALGAAFVDIAAVTRSMGDRADFLADDGLHPSAAMYAEWTALARIPARSMLRGTPSEN